MMLKLSIYAQGWVIVVVLEVGAVKKYVAGVAKTVLNWGAIGNIRRTIANLGSPWELDRNTVGTAEKWQNPFPSHDPKRKQARFP